MKLNNISSSKTEKWRNLERKIVDVMKLHDFEEIRLSVVQDSGVLKKCLHQDFFTYKKSNMQNSVIDLSLASNLCLRPEGTINLLTNFSPYLDKSQISKYYYLGNMIRVYDKEIEETYRLGAEIYGDTTIVSDITVINTALKLLDSFGFHSPIVEINSYGCENCTLELPQIMKDYNNKADQISDNQQTYSLKDNHNLNDKFCDPCQTRLSQIRHFLTNLMIKFNYNENLVRTYSYYNGMVFNLYVKQGDDKVLVGGGGRYDHLTKFVTGKEIPSIGFDLDLDSIFNLMERNNLFPENDYDFRVFICSESEELLLNEMQILQELHKKMIYTVQGKVSLDHGEAIEKAKKANCSVLLHIDNESLYKGKVELHNIQKQHSYYISLEAIIDELEIIKKSIKQLNLL